MSSLSLKVCFLIWTQSVQCSPPPSLLLLHKLEVREGEAPILLPPPRVPRSPWLLLKCKAEGPYLCAWTFAIDAHGLSIPLLCRCVHHHTPITSHSRRLNSTFLCVGLTSSLLALFSQSSSCVDMLHFCISFTPDLWEPKHLEFRRKNTISFSSSKLSDLFKRVDGKRLFASYRFYKV